MTSRPVGRSSLVLQSSAISWPRDLAGAKARRVASGDTALVEIAFDASAGQSYTFTQIVSVGRRHRIRPAASDVLRDRRPRYESLAAENAEAWGRRWQTDIEIDGDPALQRVVRSMLFYLLCSADSGTRLGIPPMGLSSGGYYGHIFWDSRYLDVPFAAADPSRRGPFAGRLPASHARRCPRERAGQRLPRRDVSLGGRRAGQRDDAPIRGAERQLRDPRQRRCRAGAVAVLSGDRGLGLARARRLSR